MESIESFLHADLKDLKDFFAYSLLCCKDFTLSFFYADLKGFKGFFLRIVFYAVRNLRNALPQSQILNRISYLCCYLNFTTNGNNFYQRFL